MSKIAFLDVFLSHGSWSLKFLKTIDHLAGSLISFVLPSQLDRTYHQFPRRILVIRPGGIGDAVFLLPILKALRTQGVSIDVLCEKRNAEIFSSQGYMVYLFKDLRQVFCGFYDEVIDTEQWHYLSAIVSYFVKADRKIGFSTRPLRAKLFHKKVLYDPAVYELKNFLKLFEEFLPGKISSDINYCFNISAAEQSWASKQIPSNTTIVFLGASIVLRRFSKKQLQDIIQGLLAKGVSPVLIGGRDVVEMAKEIVKESSDPGVLNFVGQTSLLESAALIQRSGRFIGPDSGLMHLACAVGASVTALFGPGHLEKWQPQGGQHTIITERVSCSPCTRFGYTIPTCHKTYHCVKNIKLAK